MTEPQTDKVAEQQSDSATQSVSPSASQPLSPSATQSLSSSATQSLGDSAPQQPSHPVTQPLSHPATQPKKGPLLSGSININVGPVKVERPQIKAEVKPLSQEDLERYWQEAGDALELTEVLKNATVHLGEKAGLIEIDAQTTWFADEFRQHRIKVLEYLREKSGMRMLDCKVNQLFVGKDEVVYSPDQKYNVMLENNPRLSVLRRLFPQIDY